jgi:oligosaccharide repeat unit polymerase
MLSLSATIAWYVFLAGVLWALQRLTRCLSQLNIFSLCVGFFVLRHGITVPFDHTVNQWYAGIDISPLALQRFYASLVLMWLCLLIGVWLGRRLFGHGLLDVEVFRREMTSQPLPSGMSIPLFLVVLAAGLGLVIYYQLRFEVSLVQLVSGHLTALDYRAMRDNYGTATHYTLSIGQRVANIVRFGLFPLFICTLYFMSKRGPLWRSLFGLVLGVGITVGLLSGQKGAAVVLLVGVLVAVYLRHGLLRVRPLDWRIWSFIALASFIIMPYLYHLQYSDQDYGWLLRATSYRLTSEHNRSLQLYFEIYPEIEPHLYGRSSGLINLLLGIDMPGDMLPERFIATYYQGSNYLNTWSASFVGVAWADFGYAGVVVQSVLVGLLLQGYASWFRRARKTALVMGTQVGLMTATTRLSEVALTANLLTFGLLSSFLLFWFVRAGPTRRQPSRELVLLTHAGSPRRAG